MSYNQKGVPKREFLNKVGIEKWPEGVAITFREGNYRGLQRAFLISAGGRQIEIDAFERPGRTAEAIYEDVAKTLMSLGAVHVPKDTSPKPRDFIVPKQVSFAPSTRPAGHRPVL